MTRNLKALGLALVAVLALSAVAASGASAQTEDTFRTSAGQTAHFTTKSESTQVFKGSTNDDKYFSCDEVSAEGTFKDGATQVTATNVEYTGNCVAVDPGGEKEEVSAKAEFTDCDYLFTNETTAGNPTKEAEHANVHIVCPKAGEGEKVHLKVTALNLNCVTIEQQQIAHAVRYKTQKTEGGRKDITIEATPHNIRVTTPNTVACPTPSNEPETHEDGTYSGSVSVTGYKDANHTEPTDISVE
jgi:hypothetical protein